MPIMRCLYRQTVNKKQRPQTINTLVVWDFCFCRIFFCRVLDIRVTEIMEPHIPKIPRKTNLQNFSYHIVPIIQTILFRYH